MPHASTNYKRTHLLVALHAKRLDLLHRPLIVFCRLHHLGIWVLGGLVYDLANLGEEVRLVLCVFGHRGWFLV